MSNNETLNKELFTEKFEKLSLKLEQLTDEISKMRSKLSKSNIMNRSFGLKTIRNSIPLDFTNDVSGIGSPTKLYTLSIRAITEEWKGRKNDILITIRQQEKENKMDVKALGLRIPINDIKSLKSLSKNVISLLYIACELKGGLELNDIMREILVDINSQGKKMVKEIRKKMVLEQ